eukprot:29721-Pelagococcus_subviridis.AAC.3
MQRARVRPRRVLFFNEVEAYFRRGAGVALRASAGFNTPRAVVHRRPPFVLARLTIPQRLVCRPSRNLRRLPVRVHVLFQELLASVAVGVTPRDEVVGPTQRHLIRALRTPAGFDAARAVVHLRPPRVLALQTLPLCPVVRPKRHLRRQLLRVPELPEERLPALAVLHAPFEERLGIHTLGIAVLVRHDRRASRRVSRAGEE